MALGGARPTVAELDDIGTRLFDHIFQGEVLRLYNRVPTVNFSIQIATDDPKVQRIPWEFIRPHDRLAVPHRDRCVVRVLPICAPADPAPAKSLKKLKVLLAVADPIDQAGVTWHDVESSISRMPVSYDGAPIDSLALTIDAPQFAGVYEFDIQVKGTSVVENHAKLIVQLD